MTVWIGRAALEGMIAAGRELFPLETGGVLVGWRDGQDKIIVDTIGPGPRALHGRYAFVPDHPWHIEQIGQVFHATAGDLDYLGDWHTHPGGLALLSVADRTTLRRIDAKVRGAVMVIAAGENDWQVGCWAQVRRGMFRVSVG